MAYLTKLIGFKSVILGAAVSLSFLPLSAWLSKKHAKSQRDLTKEHAALFRIISEALPSLRQIRLSSMQVLWDRNILGARDAELSQLWTSNVALAFLKLASDLAPIMLSTVALSVFAYDNGGLKPSTAFAALSLLGNLHGVVRELPLMAANLRKSWISCRRIQRYLEQPEQVPLSVPGETIRVENVSAAWPTKSGCTSSTDVFQLRNLNLTFPNGELSIITGRTGSGKSLLLATLLEEAQLHDGRLLKPRATRPNKSTAVNPHTTTQTAVVTQPPWIDDCSIRDNILFGSHFDEARYHKVLRACALQQDIETLLERDITRAGRNGAMLSGGQKWRVALARALYSPADVLILEDVLSAVDAHVARWVYENALSGELVKGRTRILVTHQPEICRDLAKYYVIVQGGTASVHERTELRAPLATHNTNMPRNSGRQTPDIAGNTNTIAVKGNEMTERNKRSYPNIFAAYLAAVGGMHACIVGVLVTLACRISSSGHSWWLARWTAQPDARSSMTYYICIYMLLSVGDGVAIAIQSIVFSSIGIRASGALFRNAIQSLLHAPLSWIDRTSLGKVLQSFGDDMYWVDRRVSVELNGLLRTTVQLVFIIFTR
jgi:ABC-type multidrug transport system fused ATPase/permease subunit